MHLTNYSINKHSKTFAQNDNIDAQEGHKWGLRAFRRRLASMGIDDEKLWQQIEDIIIKTIICMESQVNVVAGMHKFKHSNCECPASTRLFFQSPSPVTQLTNSYLHHYAWQASSSSVLTSSSMKICDRGFWRSIFLPPSQLIPSST